MVCINKKLFTKWKIVFIYCSKRWFTVVPVTYLTLFHIKGSLLWKSSYIIITKQQQQKYDTITKTEKNVTTYKILE